MADGINVANAYVQIMPSMEGASSSIADALMPALQSAGDEGGALMGSGILDKLGTLKGPLMAVGGALAGAIAGAKIGESLLNLGGEFDAMTDAIVIGTGASGDALAALEDSAKGIATSVGGSFADAGDIVQDLNTRLGLAGDDLDAVGQRVAAAGQLFGSAIDVESMSGAFAAFGVEADQMADKMDYLFGVGQATGIGFDELTGILEKNAPALQALGFSFEESANMAGLLDKAGMDASGMMGRMGKALVELAQPGETAADAYQRVLTEMQGYIDAGDEAAAMDLASSLFGTKGAAQFVGAVQSGALAMDQLTDASLGASDGIMGTFEATADWPERWEQIQNKVKVALEPLGGAVMQGVSDALLKVSEAMDEIDPTSLEALGSTIGGALTVAVDGLGVALQFVIDHKDAIAEFFASLGAAVSAVWAVMQPFAEFLGTTLAGVVIPAVEAALDLLSGDFEGARQKIGAALDGVRAVVDTARAAVLAKFDAIKSGVAANVEAIRSSIAAKFQAVKTAITKPIDDAKAAISSAISSISSIVSGVKLSLPHFALPHFNVSGGKFPWGVGGAGSPPHFSVDWYARGGFFDEPTVFVPGVGERGTELAWPSYEPYFSKYAQGIAEHMSGGNVTNLYLNDLRVNDDEAIRRDVVNLVNDLARYNRALTAAR